MCGINHPISRAHVTPPILDGNVIFLKPWRPYSGFVWNTVPNAWSFPCGFHSCQPFTKETACLCNKNEETPGFDLHMFKLNCVFWIFNFNTGFMWILFQRSWNNCWILWHVLSKYATFDTMWTNYHLVIQSHDDKYPCQNEQMTFHQSLGGACPGKRIFSIFNGRTKMVIDHETRTWRWVWPSIWSVLRARPKCRWKMVTFWLSGYWSHRGQLPCIQQTQMKLKHDI